LPALSRRGPLQVIKREDESRAPRYAEVWVFAFYDNHLIHLRCFPQIYSKHSDIPEAAGLFNPENDKDACGVGFVGELSKEPTRATVSDALEMLVRMTHRGACGCEENTGKLMH